MNNSLRTKLIRLAYNNIDLCNSRHKHLSFIVLRNKILSIGWNNGWKTNPIAKKFGMRFSSIHSEVSAICNLQYDNEILSRCKLINIRITRSGKVGMAKPCLKCNQYLKMFNFREIWYSTSDGFRRIKPVDL